MKKFALPEAVRYILDTLSASGYRADIVGGPVRDLLRGVAPSDFDITTSATPDEVKAVFAGKKIVETGIKHGTLTLLLSGESFEITTYRVDGEYKDSRHPESVSFTKRLEDDLSRRDFTMNAIAYNETDGITDLHGGEEDIKAGLIRAVGEPQKRFSEDALRILRGIRFASVLGFKIEEGTLSAMRECAHLLANVSVERIFTEWKKLLSGNDAYRIIDECRDIISVFLPEILGAELPDKALFDRAEPFVRMLALFSDVGAVSYREAMTRLHTDNATRELGFVALDGARRLDITNRYGIKKAMYEYGREAAEIKIKLDILLGKVGVDRLSELREILDLHEPYRVSELDISGNDLIAIGIKGTDVGVTMRTLLFLVMREELKNERAALISKVHEMIAHT